MEDRMFSSDDGQFHLHIPSSEIEQMLAYCRAANDQETGGILVGYYTASFDGAIVTCVSGPPKDSRASRTRFVRGIRGLKAWLQGLWNGPRHYYLGEWHFHPGAAPVPSSCDSKQMHEIAVSDSYNCPEPILVIMGGDPRGEWTLSAHVFVGDAGAIPLAPAFSRPSKGVATTP